jgi:hypothetical protein
MLPGSKYARAVMMVVIVFIVISLVLSAFMYPMSF